MSSEPSESLEKPGESEEDLAREHIVWMLELAERILKDREAAEDAVQEAFISAFSSLDAFEGRASIKTWLRRITINASLMKLRQIARRAELSFDESIAQLESELPGVEPSWKGVTKTDCIIDEVHRQKLIRRTIFELPEPVRLILYLRDIEGYDTVEVSEMLDLSESNVKVRLHRARLALKNLLEPILRD